MGSAKSNSPTIRHAAIGIDGGQTPHRLREAAQADDGMGTVPWDRQQRH